MDKLREHCPLRHENGNCTAIGGFCTAVNDPICEGLHNAYKSGKYDTIWCFEGDLDSADYFGDPIIDEPNWKRSHKQVKEEISKRENHKEP